VFSEVVRTLFFPASPVELVTLETTFYVTIEQVELPEGFQGDLFQGIRVTGKDPGIVTLITVF
jgi:hypothetical protein